MERFFLTFVEFRYLRKHKFNLEKRFNIKIILPEVFNSKTYASVHGVRKQIEALKDLMKQKTFGFTMMPLSVSVPLVSLSDSESDTPAGPPASGKEVEECTNPVKFSVAVGEENSNVAQASSNNVSVEVPLEIGHRANSSDGSIYDWTVFVRGENGCEIRHFVEKVSFIFCTYKKVIREPPYMVAGTDIAGFYVVITVFFKRSQEPRKAQFKYNVRLEKKRPPSNLRVEKIIFLNPTEEFLSMLRSVDEVNKPLRKRMRIEEATGLPPLSITSNVEGDRTVLLNDTPQEHLKSDPTASTSQAADDSIYVIDNQGINRWNFNNFNFTRNKTTEQKSAQIQHLPYRNNFFPPSLFSTHATASTSLLADDSVVAAEKGMQSGSSVNGHYDLSIIEDNPLQSRPLASETSFIRVSSDDKSAASSTSQVANDSVIVIEVTEEDNSRLLNNLNTNEVKNRNGLMGVNNCMPPNSDNEIPEASTSQAANDSIVEIGRISPKQIPRVMMGVNNCVPPNSDKEIPEASTSQAANDSIVEIGRISPKPTPRALLRNRSEKKKKLSRSKSQAGTPKRTDAVVKVPRPKCSRILRPVVIDGSNVARAHGSVNRTFSCRGVQISVDYFLERGHTRVTVFIPQHRRHQTYGPAPTTDGEILDGLARAGRLIYTPSRVVNGIRQTPHDDRFIIRLAAATDGVILSNDQYRELLDESPEYKTTVDERLLMYCFVEDLIMIPQDPAGRYGPSLDDFLSFP